LELAEVQIHPADDHLTKKPAIAVALGAVLKPGTSEELLRSLTDANFVGVRRSVSSYG